MKTHTILGLLFFVAAIILALVLVSRERERQMAAQRAAEVAAAMQDKMTAEPAPGMPSANAPLRKTVAAAAHAAVSINKIALSSRPADMQEKIRHFEDASVPVTTRLAELAALARAGDENSATILMALGSEHTYLNYAAVEALGGVKVDGVAEYLRGQLANADPRVLAAAVKSLAALEVEASVPDIAAVIKDNRQRPDGFQDLVCAACVQALGDTQAASAIPVLDAELKEAVGKTLQYDYGSKVVQALLAINKPESGAVLTAYADRLTQILAAAGNTNPMGNEYLAGKIQEARDAADKLAHLKN